MRDRLSPIDREWWAPFPLTVFFLVIVLLDVAVLWMASHVVTTDNDPAGNGMANAFRDGFVETGFYLAGILALLFAIVRRKWARIALTVLLLPATLFSMLLLG